MSSGGKIYIAGHDGFIGERVFKLISQNEKIVITRDDFKLMTEDRSSIAFFPDDIFINLAWDYLDNFRAPEHLTQCLPDHIKFYENAFKRGLQNTTCLGSCLEYGVCEGELDESLPANPSLPYTIAKDSLRRYFEKKESEGSLKYKWIRLFYLYGEGQPERTIFGQLVKAISENQKSFDMSPGLQKRDYLHIDKVVEIVTALALKNEAQGIFNCCSGIPITMIDFVKDRLRDLGASLTLNLGKYPYPSYEGMAFWGSTRKLNETLISLPKRGLIK